MSKILKAQVRLDLSIAPCKEVWFEKREEPLPLEVRALHEVLDSRGEDMDSREVYYLRWKKGGKKQKVDIEKATIEMVDIIAEKESVDIIRLMYFWQQIGPLFSGNAISINEALSKIMFANLLIGMKYTLEPEKPGMPPRIIFIEKGFLDVLKEKTQAQPKIKKWTWFFLGNDLRPELVPAQKGSWPVFSIPAPWPNDREGIIHYFTRETRRNALARITNIDPGWTKKGIITINPVSLFDAILVWHCLEKPKASIRKDLVTKTKQGVLTYFRNKKYLKKEPLSNEEYEKIKQTINRAWDKGVGTKEELMEVGIEEYEKVIRSRKPRL